MLLLQRQKAGTARSETRFKQTAFRKMKQSTAQLAKITLIKVKHCTKWRIIRAYINKCT